MPLGMSATVRIIEQDTPIVKHDHLDLVFQHGKILRLMILGALEWFYG